MWYHLHTQLKGLWLYVRHAAWNSRLSYSVAATHVPTKSRSHQLVIIWQCFAATTRFNTWIIFYAAISVVCRYLEPRFKPFYRPNLAPPIKYVNLFLDDLVYVFYLAVAFFALCAIVMIPIPLIMRRKRNAESQKENRDNREDGEYYHGSTWVIYYES